jgi:diphthine synthase
MLYLIGLGLNKESISREGFEIVKRCKKVYLEEYTVEFPYTKHELEEVLGKKLESADRKFIESLEIIDEAERKDVALLIYGSPLMATTHITLLDEAKKSRVKLKVIHAGSIFDALGETGLQLYKFGKIASMPAWDSGKKYEPDSFMDILHENKSIGSHTAILIDIGLGFQAAIDQLLKACDRKGIKKLGKIIVAQQLGTKHRKIWYDFPEVLQESINAKAPFIIVIPGKLHFVEQEFLDGIGK